MRLYVIIFVLDDFITQRKTRFKNISINYNVQSVYIILQQFLTIIIRLGVIHYVVS